MRYHQVKDGEWVKPMMRHYRMMCCDCGLVHVLRFKIISQGKRRHIVFKARRDNRATSAGRRNRSKATQT